MTSPNFSFSYLNLKEIKSLVFTFIKVEKGTKLSNAKQIKKMFAEYAHLDFRKKDTWLFLADHISSQFKTVVPA